jgi:hypothetical protein
MLCAVPRLLGRCISGGGRDFAPNQPVPISSWPPYEQPASLCRAKSYRGFMVRVMTGDQVIVRLFFEMTRVIHKAYMPDTRFGTFLDLVPVGYAILLDQAEDRPVGLTGLARFLDIPRSSVQRRIDILIEQGIVERRALKYEFAASALTGPRAVGAHRKIVKMFLSTARQVTPDEPA